jgi:hypothetical protein
MKKANRTSGSPEQQIAVDTVRRAFFVAPLFVCLGFVLGGWQAASSAIVAIIVVVGNFALSAIFLGLAARVSPTAMMGAALFGYLLRLGLVFLVFVVLRDLPWFHRMAFGLTIVVTHLGLLVWETRYVSASLAFPGFAPGPRSTRKNL